MTASFARLGVSVVAVGLLVVVCRGQISAAPGALPGTAKQQCTVLDIAAVPEKTQAISSARVSEVETVSQGDGETLTTKAEGVEDYGNDEFSLSLDAPGYAGGAASTSDVVFASGILYERNSGFRFPGAKPWISIDLPAAAKAFGLNPSQAELQAAMTKSLIVPDSYLTLAAGVTGTVTTVGTETIRGTGTIRCSFRADPGTAQRNLPPNRASAFQALATQQGGSDSAVDLWIDSQGRARRVKASSTFEGASAAESGSITVTVELYDFGAPVTISVPPASEVTDGLTLFGPPR